MEKIWALATSLTSTNPKWILGQAGIVPLTSCKRRELEKTLTKLGCQIIPFSFENHGLQSWKVNQIGVGPGWW